MSSSSVITSGGEDIIFQKIEIDDALNSDKLDIEKDFNIDKTVEWISNGGFNQIGLQFPNELLHFSVKVALLLEQKCEGKFAILGDTSFGSCCVDEVAGQHNNVDAVVHYGRACLTQTTRLPVHYVFVQRHLPSRLEGDLYETVIGQLSANLEATCNPMILLYDFQYLSGAIVLYNRLHEAKSNAVCMSWPNLKEYKERCANPNSLIKCGRILDSVESEDELTKCCIVYIGPQGLPLHNIILSFNQCSAVYAVDPSSKGAELDGGGRLVCELQTPVTNRLLKRRYHLVEKARDAQRVGILVGTLGAAGYLACIDRLRGLLRLAGKVSYTLAIGKLNAAKLANFPELDVLVLVACPENCLLDSREFYRPVITPFEMELACRGAAGNLWTAQYFVTDFTQAVKETEHNENSIEDTSAGDISLITGRVRPSALDRSQMTSSEALRGVVALKDDWSVAEVQKDHRTWRGLDPAYGETAVAETVVQGRRGIAIGYEDEATKD